jgi:hypothetical protein
VHCLGTADQRQLAVTRNDEFRNSWTLKVDDLALLKRSFPITSKYWENAKMVDAIFNRVPPKNLAALGIYYLTGRDDVPGSSYLAVLRHLAGKFVDEPTGLDQV